MDIFSHREVINKVYFSSVVRDVFRAGVVFVNPYEAGLFPSVGVVPPCVVSSPGWVLEGWSVGGDRARADQCRGFVEVALTGVGVEACGVASEYACVVPDFLSVRGEVGEYDPVLCQRVFSSIPSLYPGVDISGSSVRVCGEVGGVDSGLRLAIGEDIPVEIGTWSGVVSWQEDVHGYHVEVVEGGVDGLGVLTGEMFQVSGWGTGVGVELGSHVHDAGVFEALGSGFETEYPGVVDEGVLSYGSDVVGVVAGGESLVADSGVSSEEVLQDTRVVSDVPEVVNVACVELATGGEAVASPDVRPAGGVRVVGMFGVEERVGDVEVCSVVRESEWDVSGVMDLGMFDSVERLSLSSLGVAPRFIDAEVSVLSRDKKKTGYATTSGLSLGDFQM